MPNMTVMIASPDFFSKTEEELKRDNEAYEKLYNENLNNPNFIKFKDNKIVALLDKIQDLIEYVLYDRHIKN